MHRFLGGGATQRADRRWLARETVVFLGLVSAVFLASLVVIERDVPTVLAVTFAFTAGGPIDVALLGATGLRLLPALALWSLGVYAGAVQARRWGTMVRALRNKYHNRPAPSRRDGAPEMRRVNSASGVARINEARRPRAPGPRA